MLWLGQCAGAQTPPGEEDLALWRALDREIEKAMEDGEMSGASLLVGRGPDILYQRVYGHSDITTQEPLSHEHLFDAASLTKPLVTAMSILLLAQDGLIDLDAPLTKYLALPWKVSPTVSQLLSHHGGLRPVVSEEGLPDSLMDVELAHPPGEQFVYSDVGYMLLGRLVEKQSGMPLDEFYQSRVLEPLDLKTATFHPDPALCVPTFDVEPGTVHDPRARRLQGVAGHAGLFANARGIHQQLVGTSRLLTPEWRSLLFRPCQGGRTLGLDQETRLSSARGERFSPLTSAGHTGFTGTSFWWDEPTGIHVVLMTSRLHPDNEGNVIPLRKAIATRVGDHLLGTMVQTGLDRIVDSEFEQLEGKRVGFVVNQTSRDRFGRHLTELLPVDPDFELVSLFTPEHGLLGVRDEKIEHGFHQGLKVPIFSLYGETREPKEEWFRDIDVLVFDLQDVGVRYYTYISTLQACLEVAERTSTQVIVLDRPNPLGGVVVDGQLAREFSFIACDALPTVHGMTIGEVGLYLNRKIGADLQVFKMVGWRRDMLWRDTGLALFSPSPNLAELEAIELYPVLGQLEWCDLSVGRGTRSPFRVIGAPYIKDPTSLAKDLNSSLGPELRFQPRYFVPTSSKYEGQLCGGLEVSLQGVLERPAECGVALAGALQAHYPQHFKMSDMRRHFGVESIRESDLKSSDNDLWRNTRDRYLLYR
jgi:uncharacterized protein YbbC (DUF1343 family)/CubicO group peptidase (beta-lactamase class C family)